MQTNCLEFIGLLQNIKKFSNIANTNRSSSQNKINYTLDNGILVNSVALDNYSSKTSITMQDFSFVVNHLGMVEWFIKMDHFLQLKFQFQEGEWFLGKPYKSGKFYAKNGDLEYMLQQRSLFEFLQNQEPAIIENNKSYYYGQIFQGQKQGFGYQEWTDGTYYLGEFQHDKRNGVGRMKYANGTEYLGEFVENAYQGLGYLKYADGSFYFGKLFRNLRQGFGILKLNENHRMEGYFRQGKYNGRILEINEKGMKVTFWDDGKQLSQEECKQRGYVK